MSIVDKEFKRAQGIVSDEISSAAFAAFCRKEILQPIEGAAKVGMKVDQEERVNMLHNFDTALGSIVMCTQDFPSKHQIENILKDLHAYDSQLATQMAKSFQVHQEQYRIKSKEELARLKRELLENEKKDKQEEENGEDLDETREDDDLELSGSEDEDYLEEENTKQSEEDEEEYEAGQK